MAGFFALLYGALGLGSAVHEDIKVTEYKNNSKAKAIDNNELTYTDGRGNEFYVETDTQCETVVDSRNGHRVIRELNNKGVPTHILYDYDVLSEYRENLQFEEAIKLAKKYNKKYFYWKFNHQDIQGIGKYTGYDVEKGKRYVVAKSGSSYIMKYLLDKPTTRYKPNGTYEKYYMFETQYGDIKRISQQEYNERTDRIYWNLWNS